jgi:hypothetical protein
VTTPFTSYAFPASGGPITIGGIPYSPISRTMPGRYNDVINVKDFGAVGNGIADDTNAIYSAIIYSYSLHSTPIDGATIFFPAGTYRIRNDQPLFISPVLAIETTTSGTAGVTNQATFNFVPSALKAGMLLSKGPFPGGTRIRSVAGNTITFTKTATANFNVRTWIWITVVPSGIQQGNILLVGAGRDASIIRGNCSIGYVVWVTDTSGGTYCNGLHNLTIWNESTVTGTGAFLDTSNINNWIGYYNCTFIGTVGAHLGWQSFGVSIHSCNFYCSNLVSTASPTGPPPPPVFPTVGQGSLLSGSVGLYFAEGEIEGCFVEGFDIAYALSQNVVAMYGNRASRCNTGLNLGLYNGPGGPYTFQGEVSVFSNLFDRCNIGLEEFAGVGSRFSNLICGNVLNDVKTGLPAGPYSDGVYTPAAISRINVGAGTATVTTTQPHNLNTGGTLLELILNPSTLTPDESGNQVVAVTVTGASQFSYSLSGSGTFTNPGTWNAPNYLGVSGAKYNHVGYFSNILTSRPGAGSFALYDRFGSANDATKNNFVCATEGPYGWAGPNLGNDPTQICGSAFTYVMCGLPASASRSYSPSSALPNPIAYLKFASLSGNQYEGKEVTIVDGQKKGGGKAAFHDMVSGGGSDHYKVRYDGKNWRRVG